MTESSPPRTLRADALRNHRLIVSAARAAIEESGASVPLEDVARRAGVGVATIYRRFTGRDDLVRAVFDQYFTDEIEPLVAAASTEDDAWRGLVRTLEATVATVVDNEALLQATWEAGVITSEVAARFLEPLGDVLRRAQSDGAARSDLEPEDLPTLVAMAVTTVSRTSSRSGTGEAPGGWRRYLGVVFDGIRASGPPTPLPRTEPPSDR